jgi:hypothetical protein
MKTLRTACFIDGYNVFFNSHWMRQTVTTDELAFHQFPDRVLTKKKPAIKPDYG